MYYLATLSPKPQAAKVLCRLIDRNFPVVGAESVELIRKIASGYIAKEDYDKLARLVDWTGQYAANDIIVLAARALCTNYTRAYLARACQVAVGRAAQKGPGRKYRELKQQRRDLLECFC